MVKLVILFHTPPDHDGFEAGYNGFLALIEQMPLIQRRQVNTVLGSPLGQTHLYRVLEVYFADSAEMDHALKSEVGQRAGGALSQRFTAGTFEMYFADVYEEAGARTDQEQ